ncbi:uncharacterized protein MELLADRAFT_113603 [Melampsora larici-populina 98AG31]|uniref:C3H1-type domain-containing protein n=1 Tax=Melampsora larici-populina (strain 98AG31 / pathotype 3-4-7) TaxID=747676 RepID=F4SAG2_MELLP|nr:uncharacterized protein MELLADRAFT_113603 [Melampsora larici-populina 98AG31]EGF98383.1 hypothetical protein MELLADRAFT_113603 [Melampsora larici-populina 98AG31]
MYKTLISEYFAGSKNQYKLVQADTRPSEPDPIALKEGTLNNEGASNQVKETSNIENSYSHRLQKNLKPGNLRIEQVKEKENKKIWSGKKPPITIKTQTESCLGQGTVPVLPGTPISDSWRSKLVLEKQSFMESPKEVKIERSSPREDPHGHQSSDRVEEIISQNKDDWIIPKKIFKNSQVRKVDTSQEAINLITELPKVHHEPSSDSINSLEALKTSSKRLQNSSKKKKKKNDTSSKSNSNAGKKGKAGKDIDEDWDTDLLKALKETSASDERKETEHEKLIKNLQKRLQSIFVSDDNRKIDVPSSSSHPSYRSLMEEFLRVENHTPLLELNLKSQTVKTLREAELEAKLRTPHMNAYWLQTIEDILAEELTSVERIERIRRQKAFFLQYLLIKDSEIFKEKKDMWSQEARQVATLLHYENPFELFLDTTKEEIEFLKPHLELMAASEHELLGHLSKDSLGFRRSMIFLRIQELETPSPHGFFGKKFLEAACQQAFHMPMFRQIEIALELSAPEVSWKGLSDDELEKKYFQMLNALAGMPGQLLSSPGNSEAELYSQAESNWINSHAAQLLSIDPELSQRVFNRFKSLLMALKGNKIRPLRAIWKDSEGSSLLEMNEELISRDEALAATYVGITLSGIARLKNLLRARNIGVQGNHRPFIHLTKSLNCREGSSEFVPRIEIEQLIVPFSSVARNAIQFDVGAKRPVYTISGREAIMPPPGEALSCEPVVLDPSWWPRDLESELYSAPKSFVFQPPNSKEDNLVVASGSGLNAVINTAEAFDRKPSVFLEPPLLERILPRGTIGPEDISLKRSRGKASAAPPNLSHRERIPPLDLSKNQGREENLHQDSILERIYSRPLSRPPLTRHQEKGKGRERPPSPPVLHERSSHRRRSNTPPSPPESRKRRRDPSSSPSSRSSSSRSSYDSHDQASDHSRTRTTSPVARESALALLSVPIEKLKNRKASAMSLIIQSMVREYSQHSKKALSLYNTGPNKPPGFPSSMSKDLLEYKYIEIEKLFGEMSSKPSSETFIFSKKSKGLDIRGVVDPREIENMSDFLQILDILRDAYHAAFSPASDSIDDYFDYIKSLCNWQEECDWRNVMEFDGVLRRKFSEYTWITFGDYKAPELRRLEARSLNQPATLPEYVPQASSSKKSKQPASSQARPSKEQPKSKTKTKKTKRTSFDYPLKDCAGEPLSGQPCNLWNANVCPYSDDDCNRAHHVCNKLGCELDHRGGIVHRRA